MVTAVEARQQLEQQTQAFAQARQQIEAYPTRIQQTAQQLRQATPQSQIQVREVERQRGLEKQRAMQELSAQEKQFQTEAESIRQQIAAQEAAEAEYAAQVAAYEKEQRQKGLAYGKAGIYGEPTPQYSQSEIERLKKEGTWERLIKLGYIKEIPTIDIPQSVFEDIQTRIIAGGEGAEKLAGIFERYNIVPIPKVEIPKPITFEYRTPIQKVIESGKAGDIRRAERQEALKQKYPWYKPIWERETKTDLLGDIGKVIAFVKKHEPKIEKRETAFTKKLKEIQEKQKKYDLAPFEKKVGGVIFGKDYEPFKTISKTIEKATPWITRETQLRTEARTMYARLGVLGELPEDIQPIVKTSLEEKGFKFIPSQVKDSQIIYSVKAPEKYEKIGDISKVEREPVISWGLRKIGGAYEETYRDISQRLLFKGPTIFEPQKKITEFAPEAQAIGKAFGTIGQYQFYFLPGPIGGAISTTAFLGPTVEAATRGPKRFLAYAKQEPVEVAIAGVYGGYKGFRIMDTLLNPVKIKTFYPKSELKSAVEPFSRQRPTVLLRTKEGGYVLGKTKTGEIISFGGVPKKGESFIRAARRELFEETGLKLKIKELKPVGKVVYPEETFRLYTTQIPKSSISKLKAMSDVKKIVYIPPWRVKLMKAVTGQTVAQPISRVSLFPLGKIRAYEYGMIRKAEYGLEPTWLKAQTKYGEFILGTQSRYDVPWKYAKGYEQVKGVQRYATGTVSPPVLRKYSIGEKQFEVLAMKSQRGVPGLYIQPPSATPIKVQPSGPRALKEYISLRQEFVLGPKGIYKVTPYRQAPGYIGLSYMGYGPRTYSMGIKIGKETPTALLFKEKAVEPIVPTLKAMRGIESERIIKVGTEIATKGRAGAALLGGKIAYFQPVKILKPGTKEVIGTAIDISKYGGDYFYVAPESLAKVAVSFYPKQKYQKEVQIARSYAAPKKYEIKYAVTKPSEPSKVSYQTLYVPPYKLVEPPYVPPYEPPAYKPPTYKLTTYVPPYKPPIYRTGILPKVSREKLTKLKAAYQILIRKRGKFVPATTKLLPMGKALKFGVTKTKAGVAQTFKLLPKGQTLLEDISYQVPGRLFTQLKRPQLLTWVERRGKTLTEFPEIKELHLLKRRKSATSKFRFF